MSVSRYETSLQIVQQAAIECGLSSPSVVFASTDANVILLRGLLNSCGRELGSMREWRHLIKPGSITAVAASPPAVYGVNTLPTDFDSAIDGSFWDATAVYPLREVDAATFAADVANLTAPSPSLVRLEGNSLYLYGDAAGNTITFRYVSRYWVKPTGQSAPTSERSTADTDTLYHHPILLTRLLKLRFMQARAMDTTAALVDFETTYNTVAGGEQVHGPVRLGGGGGVRFIDGWNLPDTGWGN